VLDKVPKKLQEWAADWGIVKYGEGKLILPGTGDWVVVSLIVVADGKYDKKIRSAMLVQLP